MANIVKNIQMPDGLIITINDVPTGGKAGQVLSKASDTDNDLVWTDIETSSNIWTAIEG
jgi:hypothetical protein